MLGVNLVYFCRRKQKKVLKNKKKIIIHTAILKKRNISNSILKDFSIENISNNSYEFFCKTNNINLIPSINQNNILIVGLGDESKVTLQSVLKAFSKIDFGGLPNKDFF